MKKFSWSEFLSKKKKDIERLKLWVIREELPFQSLLPVEGLLKTIDDFPNLTCFYLAVHCNQPLFGQDPIITEKNIVFNKLFSKPIPLRKFKLFFRKPFISDGGFFVLLEALKASCPTLEKLQIIVGGNLVCGDGKINTLVESIIGLKNLRSLRLNNLSFESGKCFFEFIKAIYSLKYLRNLRLGEFSEGIRASLFAEGAEKILLKPGLRKFECRVSWVFKKISRQEDPECRLISLNEVKNWRDI